MGTQPLQAAGAIQDVLPSRSALNKTNIFTHYSLHCENTFVYGEVKGAEKLGQQGKPYESQ